MPSRLPHLTVITFSGAHGTGKTTVSEDLRRALVVDRRSSVSLVPSCSTRLFERIKSKEIRLPRKAKVPQTYDDLNRLGLRAFFQRHLPDSLSFEVESAVLRLASDRPFKPHAFLLIDRWFPDVYAYTEVESADIRLHAEILRKCSERLTDLTTWMLGHAKCVRLVNVFVPLSSSEFPVEPSDKFRATCPRDLWETTCLRNWPTIVGAQQSALFMISTSSRTERVEQILAYLRAGIPTPA